MTNASQKMTPIAKLFGWIRRSDDAMLMQFSVKFRMDRSELAECIVWSSGLMAEVIQYGDGPKLAEALPLTAKGVRDAAEAFVWQKGHPSVNYRDIEGDEEDAVAVISRRLEELGVR